MLKIKIFNKVISVDKKRGKFVINAEFKESEHPRDKDGKFTDGSGSSDNPKTNIQTPSPYSQSTLKKLFKDPYKNQKQIVDIYENHFDEVAGSMRKDLEAYAINYGATPRSEEERKKDLLSPQSLERFKNNPNAHIQEIKQILESSASIPNEYREIFEKALARAKEESKIYQEIKNLEVQQDNLKLPRKITENLLVKLLKDNGIGAKLYVANTGSKYFTFNNPKDDEESVVISIRDHFQHTTDRSVADTDYDLMIDRDNNWQDTAAQMIKDLNLSGSIATKIMKYNEYDEKISMLEKKGRAL